MTADGLLAGRVALVTGAGRGIGEAISRALAESGAQVVVTDVDLEAARHVADGIGNGRAVAAFLDVTEASSVQAALAEAKKTFGDVDVLVNNAFFATPGPFLEVDDASDRRTVEVVLLGSMTVTRSVLPGLIARQGGRIVNVISDAGRTGEANLVAYSAAKAGLAGFTKALAREVGRNSITVNGVSPGITRTQTTLDGLAASGVSEQSVARRYPLGRLGEPEDIAQAVVWLASPLASFVTGQVLSVNGGFNT